MTETFDDDFVGRGTIRVSAQAMALALEFAKSIRSARHGSRIVTFHWAESILYRSGKDQAEEDLGACLTIGAYRRDEIPMGCIETTDMLVFGVSTNETELG
jgi:hypothetical protein